jgi:hypothetical protein
VAQNLHINLGIIFQHSKRQKKPYANSKHLDIETELTSFLPRVGIKNLIRRNIKRFREMGRFIPTKAIIDTTLRVDQLMLQALNEME